MMWLLVLLTVSLTSSAHYGGMLKAVLRVWGMQKLNLLSFLYMHSKQCISCSSPEAAVQLAAMPCERACSVCAAVIAQATLTAFIAMVTLTLLTVITALSCRGNTVPRPFGIM